MLNEIEEFRAYTEAPVYTNDGKSDLSFLGRFTFEMVQDLKGFSRILTIIARGYLFKDGGDPYDKIDYARRALCAWCSIPEKRPPKEGEDWIFRTNFSAYHDEFPALVDKKGNGWLIRHVHSIIDYVNSNAKDKSLKTQKAVKKFEDFDFDKAWSNKVKQFQEPIFAPQTMGAFILRFDDAIADALELGQFRDRSFSLSADQQERIRSELPKGLPYNVAETVLAYTIANKPEDSEWTVLPVMNMSAYFGGSTFRKRQLSMMPPTLLVKDEDSVSVCRVKAVI